MKDNLTIKFLKYISKRNGDYKPVDIKELLLINFPEQAEIDKRNEMKNFINLLINSDLIELISANGIWVKVVTGRKIPKEEISALVKITHKGFDLIRENEKFIINKVGLILTILFGLSTAFLGWNTYLDNQLLKNLRDENVVLKQENIHLKNENVFLIKLNSDKGYQNKYKLEQKIEK